MQLIRYQPASPLDAYVACFWWSRRDQPEAHVEHMLPSGSAQMIFTLHETPILCLPQAAGIENLAWSGAIVHGPQTSFYRSGPKPAGAVAGVAFRPGAAGAILGVPSPELVDRHIPVEALWGAGARALRDELLAAPDPGKVFRALERHLTARLMHPGRMHPAVARALACKRQGGASFRVADIQRAAGYSPRHFIALFREAVGLTPKQYFRVQRFTTVLRHLASDSGTGLADIAASAGYADQPHLTREFRAFAGVTPTRYRPRDLDSILHHRSSAIFSQPAGVR